MTRVSSLAFCKTAEGRLFQTKIKACDRARALLGGACLLQSLLSVCAFKIWGSRAETCLVGLQAKEAGQESAGQGSCSSKTCQILFQKRLSVKIWALYADLWLVGLQAKEAGKKSADAVEPVMRTVSKSTADWAIQNDNKPLWTKSPREVKPKPQTLNPLDQVPERGKA